MLKAPLLRGISSESLLSHRDLIGRSGSELPEESVVALYSPAQ
jgi:hypothetical protein